MSCLSIFVDESGDFGPYDSKSPLHRDTRHPRPVKRYKLSGSDFERQGPVTWIRQRFCYSYGSAYSQRRNFCQSFEDVVLYYDNGQHELSRILNYILSTELSSYTLRKVLPKDYKLFQVADLICTLQLLSLKSENGELSKSEQLIFHSKRELRKTFLGPIQKKRFA